MCFIGKNDDMAMSNDMDKKCPTLRISLRQDESVERIGLICRKGLQNIKNGDSNFEFTFIHPNNGMIKETKFLPTNSKFAQEIKLVTDIYYNDIESSCPKYPINFELKFDHLDLESLRCYIIDIFNSKHSDQSLHSLDPLGPVIDDIDEISRNFNILQPNFILNYIKSIITYIFILILYFNGYYQ